MQDSSKIIQFLNESNVVSGSELGRALGISRVAVQKKLQTLIDNGLPVSAKPGVGYILEEGISLLEPKKIESLFIPSVAQLVDSVRVFQTLESTNSYLLSQPFVSGKCKVAVAETQTAGRGRRGNDWQSTPYRNIALSISWRFDHWPATITGLGLAVGLVVAEYMRDRHGVKAEIKWPNDILVDSKKLGGILVDVSGESSGACNVVIGLGLNVDQSNWSTQADYPWIDLRTIGIAPERNELIADLISILSAMLSEYERSGFTPLVNRWNELSSYAGKKIRILNGSNDLVGMMAGVDANGALLIDTGGNVEIVEDSSLSVRLVQS